MTELRHSELLQSHTQECLPKVCTLHHSHTVCGHMHYLLCLYTLYLHVHIYILYRNTYCKLRLKVAEGHTINYRSTEMVQSRTLRGEKDKD